ncbi:hypothetical protein HanXRQr2_Chr14g0636501 [Helianthus annuus]|uniref:Uncharacterized protein n=1 Tax=Helianthus annuus TaxID=4232 RepID=A0A9K3E9H2_HELAN|nr:hypothetical protein HanXRQr2_Chr14g0636501 [Helianthus annuus]
MPTIFGNLGSPHFRNSFIIRTQFIINSLSSKKWGNLSLAFVGYPCKEYCCGCTKGLVS